MTDPAPTPTPTPTPTPDPATPAAGAAATPADAKAAEEEKPEEDSPPIALPREITRPTYEESSITASHQDPRFSPPYKGMTVLFLNGDFANQVLDLGSNIYELDEEQSANWEELQGRGGRTGKNFNNISPRTFRFQLDFFDPFNDISQLVENCCHLQEVMDLSSQPPLIQLTTGVRTIKPVVCDSISIHYDQPFPEQRGWRHATVQLSFFLDTTGISEHFLAVPLGPTPLGDYRQRTTQAERQREEQLSAVKNFLAPCLGEKGTEELEALIESGEINDPEALSKLSPNTLLQLSAAGISKETLQDERLRSSLRTALAVNLSEHEGGANSPQEARQLTEALLSGNAAGLGVKFTEPLIQVGADGTTQTTTTFDSLQGDFDVSLQAILDQKLGEDSEVFDRSKHPTAHRRLSGAAGCGLQLRSSGMAGVLGGGTSEDEASVLSSINSALGDSRFSDDDLKKMFGMGEDTPQTVIAQLRNGGPYTSQAQFLSHLNINRQGITANGMLQSFKRNNAGALGDVNAFLQAEDTTVEQIKERLGVSDEVAAELKSKTFASRQEFLDAAGGGNAWETVLSVVNEDGFAEPETPEI